MNPLIYILLSLLTIAIGYFVFRVAVRRDYQEKGKLSNLSTFLEFFIFALHANLSYTFLPAPYPEIPALPESSVQRTLGLSIMILGIFFTLWAMSGLGFKKAVGKDQNTLNRFGFYQYLRNPQILFYGIAILGIALLWVSFYSLGWVLIYGIIAHMMVITEEEHLLHIYKEDYEDYCREVPRYFPVLWRKKTKEEN
jgi:protein-S-isoprenylcysteine O-methyltransferase Ste14